MQHPGKLHACGGRKVFSCAPLRQTRKRDAMTACHVSSVGKQVPAQLCIKLNTRCIWQHSCSFTQTPSGNAPCRHWARQFGCMSTKTDDPLVFPEGLVLGGKAVGNPMISRVVW